VTLKDAETLHLFFMKFLTLVLGCVISAGCLTEEKLIQRAAFHLAKITEVTPDTGKLESRIVLADAKYTLLHIRQQHYSDIYTARVLERLERAKSVSEANTIKKRYLAVLVNIDSVQKEIVDYLLSVCDKTDVLYSEGLPFPTTYRQEFIKEYLEETRKEVMKVVSYQGEVDFVYPYPAYFTGASIFLKKHNKINVFGVEHGNLLDLTLSTYSNKELAPSLKLSLIKECHAEREQQMLINMAGELDALPYLEPSLKFLICGSKHDFSDDIERWNRKNPKRKYNLLVFTPNTLRKE
jgi:hypothetical protein